jgi:hypothetical protein
MASTLDAANEAIQELLDDINKEIRELGIPPGFPVVKECALQDNQVNVPGRLVLHGGAIIMSENNPIATADTLADSISLTLGDRIRIMGDSSLEIVHDQDGDRWLMAITFRAQP